MSENSAKSTSNSVLEKFLDASTLIIVVASAIVAIYFYGSLPDTIPTHMDINGNIDGYGNKATVFIIPMILFPTAITLWWLKRYPKLFNYPVKITAENEDIQYSMARTFVSVINLLTALLLLFIEVIIINFAVNNTSVNSLWIILGFSAIIVLSIPVYYLKAKNHR